MPTLGDLPIEREDGIFQIMHGQMNSCSSKEVWEYKVETTRGLVRNYDENLAVFNELGFNFKAVNSSQNLSSWFRMERETRCVTSNNEHDPAVYRHQQGGCGMICFHDHLQYARTTAQDSRRLGQC